MANIIYNGFPYISNIDARIQNELNSRMSGVNNNSSSINNRLLHKSAWCKITSGVYASGAGADYTGLMTLSTFSIPQEVNQKNNNPTNYGVNNIYRLNNNDKIGILLPGIEEVSIEHMGNDGGGIRKAKINWKTYSIQDFELLSNYFLSVGHTCIVEWGVVNDDEHDKESMPLSLTDSDIKSLSYDNFNNAYTMFQKRSFKSNGKYDGLAGIITNYEFRLNDVGGFDCVTEVTSIGSLMYGISLSHQYNSNEPDSKILAELKSYIVDNLEIDLKTSFANNTIIKFDDIGYHAIIDTNANTTDTVTTKSDSAVEGGETW